MPTRLLARIDLDKLYLPFLQLALETLAACQNRGAVYIATHGFRTQGQQAALYFQGRTMPGPIVTNARPGYSLHNYGIALDVVRDASPAPGLQPDWNAAAYDVLADEADKHGLQANIPSGKDYGHIQLPLHRKLNTSELECLRALKSAADPSKLLDEWGPW